MHKKPLFLLTLLLAATGLWADEVPTLHILTSSQGEVLVPITELRSITYDKSTGTQMFVTTASGTTTYAVSDVQRITLGTDDPSDLPAISVSEARNAQKILINGTICVLKDNKLFTLKGEAIQ